MGCKECGKPKCNGECGCKSPKVLQINNPAEYITFHKVSIPAAMGDSTTNPPKIGAYRNALVYYEADHTSWMYSTDGIPTLVTGEQGETGPQGPAATVAVGTTTTGEPGTQARVYNSGTDFNAVLNFEIPRGDVGPSVPLVQKTGNSTTKAMSQNATTEALNGKQNTLTAGSNIQISGSTISATDTKYSAGNGITLTGTQFSANTSVLATKNDLGSYYTKTQIDSQMAAKQDDLVAGSNIQIAPDGKTISATDTKYTAGNGLNLNGTEFSADTTVLATKEDLEDYYTKPEADNLLAPKLEAEVVAELPTTGTEGKLYLTPKAHTSQTATGNPITIALGEDEGAIDSFQLDGDTFQQSYTGKNLFNIEAIPYVARRAYGPDGAVLSWNDYTGTDEYQPVEPSTEYTLWNNKTGNTTYLCEYDENKTFIQRSVAVRTFTTTATTKYLRWSLSLGSGAGTTPPTQTQLELGSTATSYEQYVGGQPSPSPDYPQQIQTVTGLQTVEIQGKNLLRYPYTGGTVGTGLTWTVADDGTIRVAGTIGGGNKSYYLYNRSQSDFDMPEIPAGTYKVFWSIAGSGSSPRLTIQDANGYHNSNASNEVTITTSAKPTNIYIQFAGSQSGDVDLYIKPMIVPSDQADVYAPYSHQALPLDLGTIELCKLGTFQDYIWKDGEDWKVHKATVSAIIDGSESWNASGTNTFYVADIYSKIGNSIQSASTGEMYASHFTIVDITSSNTLVGASLKVDAAHDISNLRIRLQDMSGGTAGFRQMLSAKKPSIYARRLTPTDTTITDSNLIAQLEAIRTASLQNGANTITNTATGSNLAGDMEISCYKYDPRNRYDKWLWLDINNEYEQIGS